MDYRSYGVHGFRFEHAYYCYSFSSIGKPHLENGGKIILPASALHNLFFLKINFPYMFEIQNVNSGRVSHCGVLEFTADEGSIIMPEWMMKNMQLDEGDPAMLTSKTLETGTYFKIQPHTKAFIELVNPKAVLENRLRNFACLSTGDTIMVMHNDKKYYIDIVETRPEAAISILETDCEVNFAPPLDYKEPVKPSCPKVVVPVKVEEEEPNKHLKPKFRPFIGVARRLDGKPLAVKFDDTGCPCARETMKKDNPISGLRKHSGNLVFGCSDTQIPNKSAKVARHEQKEERSNKLEPKFQPFTGKKYSLTG